MKVQSSLGRGYVTDHRFTVVPIVLIIFMHLVFCHFCSASLHAFISCLSGASYTWRLAKFRSVRGELTSSSFWYIFMHSIVLSPWGRYLFFLVVIGFPFWRDCRCCCDVEEERRELRLDTSSTRCVASFQSSDSIIGSELEQPWSRTAAPCSRLWLDRPWRGETSVPFVSFGKVVVWCLVIFFFPLTFCVANFFIIDVFTRSRVSGNRYPLVIAYVSQFGGNPDIVLYS